MTPDMTPLVDTAWLDAHSGEDDLVILDIRTGEGAGAAFEAGHVPASLHSDYAKDGWRASRGPAAGSLPDQAALEALLSRLGIRPRDRVVIVPAGAAVSDFSAAARVYWTLKVAGHAAVAILDGGYSAWLAAQKPVEQGPARRPDASLHPVRIDESLRATLAEVQVAVERSAAILLDGRSRASFEGAEKSPQAARAGRLPGARHLDHAQAYDAGAQRLKPVESLKQLYAAIPEEPVISYCNTGHLAATNWFILSELLHRPNVRLYDGSMSEWSADPARPIATGSG